VFRLDGVFRSPWSEAQQPKGAQSSGLPVLTVHQNPAVSHSATIYIQTYTLMFNAINTASVFLALHCMIMLSFIQA